MTNVLADKKSSPSFIMRILGLGDLSGLSPRSLFSFWSMVLLVFFLYGDQNLTASNLSRIGADFGFAEKEQYLWYIGGLSSAFFFVVGGTMSIVTGALSDRFEHRKKLFFFLSVFLGEIPCLMTAFAPNYTWFLILRTLTGLGLGGIFPIIFKVMGDYFQPENRPTASAWLGLSMALGIGVGQLVAGELAHKELFGMAGWRASFIVMAAPSFPLVILFYLLGGLPERGAADKERIAREKSGEIESTRSAASPGQAEVTDLNVEDAQKIIPGDFGRVFKIRTNILVFLQGMFGTVPWGFLFRYIVDFYETKGFTVQEANGMILLFGGTAIFGGFFGGFLGKLIYRHRPRHFPLFCGITVLLGIFPILYIVNYEGRDLLPVLVMAVLAGIVAPMTGANVRAIIINTNLPENRGAVFAVFNLTDDLGKGLGPFFVGLLIMIIVAMFPGDQDFAQVLAYNVAILFWIPCGLIWFLIWGTMYRDEARVHATLKERG